MGFKAKVSGLISKGKFQFDKNKGLIFTILSAGFEIAAIIAMAKQSPKAEKVLVPANKKIAKLKEELKDRELIDNHLIYPEDHKKEIRKIQKNTFVSLAKIYSVPVILTGLSLTFMGGSWKVMHDKQVALGAAYVTLDTAFKSYRDRVKAKLGEEAEKKLFRGTENVNVTQEVVDPETGEVKEITKNIEKSLGNNGYEVFFDGASPIWEKNGRTNWETLMRIQESANILLKKKKYIFLFEVLDMLDIPKTTINKDLLNASRCVGWIYDPYNPNRSCWVSFGISDEQGHCTKESQALFENAEKTILLTFNVDGVIISDKLEDSYAYYLMD